MKRIFYVFLIVLVLFSISSCVIEYGNSPDNGNDNDSNWNNSQKSLFEAYSENGYDIKLKEYSSIEEALEDAENKLVVPDTFNGKKVESVYISCLKNGLSVELSIKLPITIKKLAVKTDVKTLNIPRGLNELELTGSVENVTEISDSLYYSLENKIIYTKDKKTIIKALSSLSGNLNIPSTVKTISELAFSKTKLDSVTMGENVVKIGDEAFKDCSNLETVNMATSSGKTYNYGKRVFQGSAITQVPNSYLSRLSGVLDSEFTGCTALTSVNLPSGVTVIGENCFKNCTALTSVNLQYGVTAMREYSFASCTNLSNLVIPNTVTEIGQYALFKMDGSVLNVIFQGTEDAWNSIIKIENWYNPDYTNLPFN